ncbi:hypothetical protein Peur_000401 [Populus x canadensis]
MELQVYGRIYLETLHAKSRCQPATIHEFLHSRQFTGLLSWDLCHFYCCSLENWNFLLKYDISPSRPMMLVLLANLIVVLHFPFHLLFLFLTLDLTMFSLKKVNYRREAPEMGRYYAS